ncbi:MAG: DUF2812 domain-containing protein [Clostridiales bacterium]|nr:DUF2812 domain-containing protein [Clostridiales bacterium]
MRKKVHKLFWIWQLEKEQAWVNDMAEHGYALVRAGRFTFEFDDSEPGIYIYKEIFLKGSSTSSKNIEYFKFLEEMGITEVCAIDYPNTCWVYLRALKEDYPNGIELYSDVESKITYESVMMWYLLFVVIVCGLCSALNYYMAFTPNNGVRWLNLITASGVTILMVIALIDFIKRVIRINKLKKERKIHE